ncbi:MAG: PKD domain-containing protein [Thermoplasmata archaeon]
MRATPLTIGLTCLLLLPAHAAYVEWDAISDEESTHQFLLDQMLVVLSNDGYPELADYLGGLHLVKMKQGSMRADETLLESREHYMDPSSHAGLIGFKSAGTLSTEQFDSAVSHWNAGDRQEAFYHLGWAAHLVHDLTVPHHAALTFLDYHSEYEAWVHSNRKSFAVQSGGIYEFDSYLAGHYENESDPFDWVDYNAHFSIQYFGYVDGPNGQGGNDYAYAAGDLLPRAQRTSAGFVMMFLRGVNQLPTADGGGDKLVGRNKPVLFDASASADDMGIANWTWDFGDGSTGHGKKEIHSYADLGTHQVRLTVRDILGEEANCTLSVLVVDISDPIATAGEDRHVAVGEPVRLDASASSDDTGIVNFMWTLNDTVIGYGETVDWVFSYPGIYTATLVAKDASGNHGFDSVIIYVEDVLPPTADAGGNATVGIDENWTFDASASSDDVGIKSFVWSFGDGASGTGERVNHSYDREGVYLVTLLIRDHSGNADKARASVTVVGEAESGNENGWLPWLAIALALVAVVILSLLFMRRWMYNRMHRPTRNKDEAG